MRLILISIMSLLAISATAPAWSTVLPLVNAQEVRDPKSPVVETDVNKTIYDEQGQPVTSAQATPSSPRRSLAENLRILRRRGYTIPFEPGEVVAIEQSPVARRNARGNLTAFALGEIAYGSLSAGDTNLSSRIQPITSFFQPLWTALVPTSITDPSTGQIVTVLVVVLGPSAGQNGLLSAIGGNTVLADLFIAPAPFAAAAVHSIQLSTLQRFGSFVALPSQGNDGDETSNPTPLLDAADDPTKSDNRVVGAEMSSAVPEPSTWAMILIGFFGLAFTPRARKTFKS